MMRQKHTLKGHLKTVLIAFFFGMAAYGLIHILLYLTSFI